MERRSLEVPPGHSGEAVALILHDGLGVPHSHAKGLIDAGCVTLNGRPVTRHGQRCDRGDTVEVRYDPDRRYAPTPPSRPGRGFRVVHEDPEIVVVDKEPGVLSSPAPGEDSDSLAERIAESLRARGFKKAQLYVVHRLDRHTSGLLVFAKTPRALESMTAQFESHEAGRTYVALVEGAVKPDQGTIQSWLAEDPRTLSVRTTPLRGAGKRALTHFRVVERYGEAGTLVRVQLETGRKHQIRIHLAEIGHPVLGDRRYGPGSELIARVALHAERLTFRHPRGLEPVTFEAPQPADLTRLAGELRKISMRPPLREGAARGEETPGSGPSVPDSKTRPPAGRHARVVVFPAGLTLSEGPIPQDRQGKLHSPGARAPERSPRRAQGGVGPFVRDPRRAPESRVREGFAKSAPAARHEHKPSFQDSRSRSSGGASRPPSRSVPGASGAMASGEVRKSYAPRPPERPPFEKPARHGNGRPSTTRRPDGGSGSFVRTTSQGTDSKDRRPLPAARSAAPVRATPTDRSDRSAPGAPFRQTEGAGRPEGRFKPGSGGASQGRDRDRHTAPVAPKGEERFKDVRTEAPHGGDRGRGEARVPPKGEGRFDGGRTGTPRGGDRERSEARLERLTRQRSVGYRPPSNTKPAPRSAPPPSMEDETRRRSAGNRPPSNTRPASRSARPPRAEDAARQPVGNRPPANMKPMARNAPPARIEDGKKPHGPWPGAPRRPPTGARPAPGSSDAASAPKKDGRRFGKKSSGGSRRDAKAAEAKKMPWEFKQKGMQRRAERRRKIAAARSKAKGKKR